MQSQQGEPEKESKGVDKEKPITRPKMKEDVGVCTDRLDSQVELHGRVICSPMYLAVPGT